MKMGCQQWMTSGHIFNNLLDGFKGVFGLFNGAANHKVIRAGSDSLFGSQGPLLIVGFA
jgi:hypothetical protein